ncbi:MAG: carbohydrate ABC transporter permease [Sphaerochaetaceae bacterium]|nr:sugar ABC transporter permease [Sphaerochaetaceae bacterium]HHU89063.1 sugar ABC transporter permease [Spirochaetales bacterium]
MKRSKRAFWLFVLPSLIIYVLFMLLPLVASLGLSFFEWSGYGAKKFVWFRNYVKLFTEAPNNVRLGNALKNNLYFFIITMVIQNLLALMLAIFLQRGFRGFKALRTIFFAPSTVSVIIVGFLWTLIYNPIWGPLNNILGAIGLDKLQMAWLGSKTTALTAIAVANAWQYTGIPMMLFVAGLNSIPNELYEACSVDGGSEWHKFRYVTIPSLKSVLLIVATMTFVGNFSSFEIIYAMEGTLAGPNYATDVLGTLFYRTTFGARTGSPPDMGLGATIATVMSVLIGVGVLFWLRLYVKEDSSEGK